MDKRFKGLVAISDVLDDRYQKLSDKYHELELSHNRKKNALHRIMSYVERENPGFRNFSSTDDFFIIHSICKDALFCDGREKTCLKLKSIIKGSKKNANSSKLEK